ncbi:MAG TPA: SGNH/GDSL hydrolase family protein, partial [Gammaproteobacteria bacterium]|nr:SGNH/GDSL hydrolase family protein [Gammaproteobacteria bacterium]
SIICLLFVSAHLFAFERIIVFGDSYSDNGNDFKISQQKYPNKTAYFQGRFSDGPVWVEYFAELEKINPNDSVRFINLAYGQAKILSPTKIMVKPNQSYPIPDLGQQISAFISQYKKINADDLIIIFISANDFFDVTQMDNDNFVRQMADQMEIQVNKLIALGAKNIIILNGRDVTYSPLATIVAKQQDVKSVKNYLQDFQKLIQAYNKYLNEKLNNKPEVFIFDIFQFDNRIIAKIQQGAFDYKMNNKNYTFTNATEGCYQNNKGDYEGVAGPICADASKYFYYDRIHTTRYANYILAQKVFEQYHSLARSRE